MEIQIEVVFLSFLTVGNAGNFYLFIWFVMQTYFFPNFLH